MGLELWGLKFILIPCCKRKDRKGAGKDMLLKVTLCGFVRKLRVRFGVSCPFSVR